MTVTVEHKFPTDGGNLYDAILDPQMAPKFLFATTNGTMVRSEIDARVGGRFDIVERRDGQDVLHTGEYLELVRPSRIVFTLAVPAYSSESSRVEIDIAPAGEGCELTLTHSGVLDEYADSTREGWKQILLNAQRLLEA